MARRALSVSQWDRFDACRWAYREQTIFRKPSVTPDFFVFGRMEHALIQRYIEHLIAANLQQDPGAIQGVVTGFVAKYEESLAGSSVLPAARLLERFARDFTLDLDRVWKPEAETCVTWDWKPCGWWDADVGLRMRLDLPYIDGPSAEIHDFKTSWAVPPEASLKDDMQPLTYALGLHIHNPDIRFVRVVFRYVRYGITRSVQFGEADFEEAKRLWLSMSDRVEEALKSAADDRKWQPTAGSWCYSCGVRQQCPLKESGKLRAMGVIAGEEEAKAAAEEILALDAAKADRVANLKLWAAENGGLVPIGDGAYGFHKRRSLEYDVTKIVAAALEMGVPPSEFMKVDGEEVAKKRFQKKWPLLAERIAEHCVDVGGSEFRFRKSAPDEEGL